MDIFVSVRASVGPVDETNQTEWSDPVTVHCNSRPYREDDDDNDGLERRELRVDQLQPPRRRLRTEAVNADFVNIPTVCDIGVECIFEV